MCVCVCVSPSFPLSCTTGTLELQLSVCHITQIPRVDIIDGTFVKKVILCLREEEEDADAAREREKNKRGARRERKEKGLAFESALSLGD